jgi:hypothetical protein
MSSAASRLEKKASGNSPCQEQTAGGFFLFSLLGYMVSPALGGVDDLTYLSRVILLTDL